MMTNKPRAFISYAHRGDMGFTPRLAFALELSGIEVLWDQKLQMGSWQPQLQEMIRDCDYFLVVMSQLFAESQFCQNELNLAYDSRRTICPLKVHSNYIDNAVTKSGELEYCDFSDDFEVGFRKLTQLLIHNPLSSWEWLGYEDDDAKVLVALQKGHLPGVVTKIIGDWVIVEQLWAFVDFKLEQKGDRMTPKGRPLTPKGILRQIPNILQYLADRRDFAMLNLMRETQEIVSQYLERLPSADSDHNAIADTVFEVITQCSNLLSNRVAMERDFARLAEMQAYQGFNTSEKIRELVISYARRSRYLF